MNWVHEHWRLSIGLACAAAAGSYTLCRLNRWRQRFNLQLDRYDRYDP